MRYSRRSRPELPPSSVTVTIAVRSAMGCFLAAARLGDVLLKAVQHGGKTGPSTKRDHPHRW